jgi:hypothetical protein
MDQRLEDLERRRDELINLGIWSGCFLECAKAGGTARSKTIHYRARAYRGETFENGRKTKYISAADLGWVRGCIARGQEVAQLDKAIAKLTA